MGKAFPLGTSTSKDYFVRAVDVNFAAFPVPLGCGIPDLPGSSVNKAAPALGARAEINNYSFSGLRRDVQAAWESDSIFGGLK